jgi:hypothetical protein
MLLARRFTLNPAGHLGAGVLVLDVGRAWRDPGRSNVGHLKIVSDRVRPLKALGHVLEEVNGSQRPPRRCISNAVSRQHTTPSSKHQTNTQGPLNEQAGTSPFGATIGNAQTFTPLRTKGFAMSNTNPNIAARTVLQDGTEQIEAAAASMNSMPAGIHAIATAYSDYSKKSFEDARLFVEKLSGVKSVDKAIELQSEYAKSSFELFMAESQKIGALYRDLAMQSYKPFSGLLGKRS